MIRAAATQPMTAKCMDDALVAIERDDKSEKGVLPKDYAQSVRDKQRLGELNGARGTI